MPLFSEHIANMYYGSSSPYTGSPYSYSSSANSPLGSSYSASYLNPGGSYSNHSSLSSYSRAPLSSRWVSSAGRNYSPHLTTITERGSASPVRIHSPRRIPISSRTYGTPNYTPRPVNINTADIDVSKDRYRHKAEPPTPTRRPTPPTLAKPEPSPPKEDTNNVSESGPFMPRVDGKPETGIDSSPGVQRSTIKRGRTVVRLYTIKRNSPRKPNEEAEGSEETSQDQTEQGVNEENKIDEKEFMKWREKLSDDLTYKDKKEKKTMGAKLVEKFHVKNEKDWETPSKVQKKDPVESQSLPATPAPKIGPAENICLDRRCSMELLAEQANLLDSLIRSENLSTATLDLSKVGIAAERKNNLEAFESNKRRKQDSQNPLKTTKSDYSLHDSLKSYKDVRDPRNFSKRRSIKKSSSGSSLRRLDSITEFPKEQANVDLPAIEESRLSVKQDNTKEKPKPKLKNKITSSVEVTESPTSPLKFRIENVTVEEKLTVPKKEITYSSEVEKMPQLSENVPGVSSETNKTKKTTNKKNTENDLESPEPDDGNFWNKIGKRETVYLVKRKKILEEAKEKHMRSLAWFPEDEVDNSEEIIANIIGDLNQNPNNATSLTDSIQQKETDKNTPKVPIHSLNISEEGNKYKLDSGLKEDVLNQPKDEQKEVNHSDINKESEISHQCDFMDETVINVIPELTTVLTKEIEKDNKYKLDSGLKEDVLNQPKDEQKEVNHSDIKKESEISHQCDFKDETVINVIPELTTVLTKEIEKDNSKLIEECKVQNSDTTTVKLSSVSNECKNIGKSASLDAIDENKDKKPSQKKTKSEKSKKLIKKDVKTELKSLQAALPKAGAKTEVLKTLKTLEDTSANSKKLDESRTLAESVHKKSATPKPVDELKKEDEKPSQLPENQFAEQRTIELNNLETKNTTVDLSKDLSKVGLEQNEVIKSKEQGTNDKEFKTNTNMEIQSSVPVTSSNTTSKIADPTVTADLSETIVSDASKNVDTVVKSSPKSKSVENIATTQNTSQLPEDDKVDKVLNGPSDLIENKRPSTDKPPCTCTCSNNAVQKSVNAKNPNSNKNFRAPAKSSPEPKSKVSPPAKNVVTKSDKTDDKLLQTTVKPSINEETSTLSSNAITSKSANITANVPDMPVVFQSQDIPKEEIEARVQIQQNTGEENKAENIIKKDEQPETSTQAVVTAPVIQKKPVKEERALKPLIATPRPLQKKAPQVIHSDTSESSSEEESSDEEDEDESDESEASAEFYESENNPDGRTSTGSNDSGFDSSAPASPATFSQIKKGGEAPGTSSGAAPAQANNTDLLEQQLEQSTAYDIFRKTGRFTPPARSIPRFRKYTVEDFQFIKVLGKGSFGKVLLAELRDTEYYYAVKCLKKDVVLEDDDVECTLIERKVLALGTNHPYLCHLFATFQTDSHLFFVMEYLNGGDLMFHIQQSGRFPEARARFYAAEIVSGLKFLHKRGIVYRDLKLDNILLDFEGHVRIADFGMCKLQIYLEKTADTFCGTPDYMAPEIIKGLKYNQTVDWWSFGVLLYEMLIGQSPFSGCDEDELFWSICNEMPSYPRFLSQEALTILTRLLDKDARTRLGGTECMHGDIREQDFFHAIHWDRLERRDLETPFRPRVRHPMDTQYFDKAFTGERPRLTAVEPQILRSMDQEPFRGFSYTNPNTTDR